MAIVDFSEFRVLARDERNDVVATGVVPALVDQQVSIGGASAQSAAFSGNTRIVRIHTDAPCRIAFGANPTASATSPRYAANSTEYVGVTPGHKAAVITTT